MNISRFRGAWALTLALGLSAPVGTLLSGCSKAEKQEASADTATAYNDFKTYVEGVERDIERVDVSDTEFSEEMNRGKADFDAKLAAAERDAEQFTDEQRAEIATLKTRYTTAFEQREAAYRARQATQTAPATGTASNTATVSYTPAAAGYAALPAASLRATYEEFVRNAKANEGRYGIEEWRAVNDDWRALNARKDAVEKELSLADRAEIAKEKIKYAAIKSYDKGEARAAEGADATKTGAYKAGEAIGRGASKTGEVLEEGASKVGNAAKDAYKGARNAVKNDKNER